MIVCPGELLQQSGAPLPLRDNLYRIHMRYDGIERSKNMNMCLSA